MDNLKFVLGSIGILILTSLISAMIKTKGNAKHYVFRTKYNYSSITLFENGKFTQSKHGCTYAFTCKGHWMKSGDTINLNQDIFKKTRGNYRLQSDRSNRLLILNDSSVSYLWNVELGFVDDFIMRLEQK